jgi:hypothetical protein
VSEANPNGGRLQRLLREPLLHFVVLGALVFGAERLARRPAENDRAITLTPAIKAELEKEYTRRTGKSADGQLESVITQWVTEEVLYREGIRLGLDRGDIVVRDRVVAKMKSVNQSLVLVREPSDAELDAWLAAKRAQYETPVRVDFEHVFALKDREKPESRSKEFLEKLSAGAKPDGLGDPFPQGARHERRSIEYVTRTFGKGFADAIAGAPPGTWRLAQSDHGWHAVRVTHREGGEPPTREALRAKLVRDWQTAEKKKLAEARLAEIVKSYSVVRQP